MISKVLCSHRQKLTLPRIGFSSLAASYKELEIRVGHESPVDDALSRARFPFAADQPRSFEPLKGDKWRTGSEAENAFAHLFEPDGDPISMHGFGAPAFSK